MSTPKAHAVVSASSFERWSHCTAAPRYEEQFPSGTTEYAEEGTLAHSVCELFGKKKFKQISTRKFNSEIKKLQEHERWKDEMLKTAEFYANYLAEIANVYPSEPFVVFEKRVDLTDYIPEGFGSCDCIMIGGDTLRITDYKHGTGIPVSSVNNGQMRLYALGALKFFQLIYGDAIKKVYTAIVQPRITEDVTEECLTVEELRAWGETVVKPKAQAAFYGMGEFASGDWCRFCRGKAQCRARAEYNAGFTEYVGKIPEKAIPKKPNQNPCLSNAEIADLLEKAAGVVAWYKDLQDYAQQAILDGGEIPGWKVVEGKSVRAFRNVDEALERMRKVGYEDAVLFTHDPISLAQMEKLTGKAAFAELMEGLIFKPQGKPTLVTADDSREPYKSVGPGEFSGVTDG